MRKLVIAAILTAGAFLLFAGPAPAQSTSWHQTCSGFGRGYMSNVPSTDGTPQAWDWALFISNSQGRTTPLAYQMRDVYGISDCEFHYFYSDAFGVPRVLINRQRLYGTFSNVTGRPVNERSSPRPRPLTGHDAPREVPVLGAHGR
jgi:hypothetical protein